MSLRTTVRIYALADDKSVPPGEVPMVRVRARSKDGMKVEWYVDAALAPHHGEEWSVAADWIDPNGVGAVADDSAAEEVLRSAVRRLRRAGALDNLDEASGEPIEPAAVVVDASIVCFQGVVTGAGAGWIMVSDHAAGPDTYYPDLGTRVYVVEDGGFKPPFVGTLWEELLEAARGVVDPRAADGAFGDYSAVLSRLNAVVRAIRGR